MRYAILLAMLLLCLPVRGEAWQVVCASGGCDPAENEIGIRSIGVVDWSAAQTSARAFRFQADCSGPISTANIYANSTASTNIKIAVYNSTAESMSTDKGMTLVGYSGAISSGGSVGWKSGSVSSGNVTAGSYYWVIVVISGPNWTFVRNETTAPFWYNALDEVSFYDEFPSTMPTNNWYSESAGGPSIYISIGG